MPAAKPVELTQELLAELSRPFTPAAVKFKPQTVTKDITKGLASFYIDARLAAERLNEVVGAANWQDEYRLLADGRDMPALFYPVECKLTVCGVTRTDVGQGANTVLDDKAWKSAYSDALKRAAVKFRIGAYLYTLPNLWAPVKVVQGKARGFSDEGVAQLRGQYERWLKSPLNTYGAALDHGDVVHEDSGGEPRRDAGLTAASPSAASDAAASRPEPAVGGQGAVPASAPTAELPDWPQLRAELEGLLREFGGQELVDKSLPLIAKHDGDCGWATVQIAKTRANLAAKAEGKSPFQAPAGARDAA